MSKNSQVQNIWNLICNHSCMKNLFILILVVLFSCHENKESASIEKDSTGEKSKTGDTEKVKEINGKVLQDTFLPVPIHYSNARFRDVWVKRTGATTFTIQGKAQVFEAAFSWVIEDGHNEIKSGHEMTNAGAPEWGSFEFKIAVAKKRETTLTLILFESSPKDGSRQYELPVKLY